MQRRTGINCSQTAHGKRRDRWSKPSRFINEIPPELLDTDKLQPVLGKGKQDDFDESGLPWNQGTKSGVSRFGMGYNAYASKTASPTGSSKSSGMGGFGSSMQSLEPKKKAGLWKDIYSPESSIP